MDTRKNSKLQHAKSASKAGGSRVYGKIPRQSAQVLSALAMEPLVTNCFQRPSLKSVPFGSDPFSRNLLIGMLVATREKTPLKAARLSETILLKPASIPGDAPRILLSTSLK